MLRRLCSTCWLAFALCAVTLLATAVTPVDEPLMIDVLPIAVAAYVGGRLPGLVATATMTLGSWLFVLPPRMSLSLPHPMHFVELAMVAAIGVAITALCVSMRRAQQQAEANAARAQDSERRLKQSFHSSPVPLVLSRAGDDRIIEFNAAYLKLVGFTRSDITGRTPPELGLYPQETADRLRRMARSSPVRAQAEEIAAKTGCTHDVEVSIDEVVIDGESHLLTAYTDQTKCNQALGALKESDARLRDLASAIDDMFWLATPDLARMLYVSPGFEKIFGRPASELFADASVLAELVHPDDRARFDLRADHGDVELRIVRPDGTIRWVQSKSFPVRDRDGDLVRVAGVISDITDHRLLEEQLRQTQKMESLGMLAGGVAHDFNNLLAVISSCNGLLAETIPSGHDDRELVDEIEQAVTRATGMTRQLLAFSRKQAASPVVLDMNSVIDETCKMLRRMVGEDITISLSLERGLSRVLVDAGNLVQVLMNLAVNARDAMPRGGKLEIATRTIAGANGRSVCLSVIDTGEGMTEEVRRRVFEPFFTTKERGKGTGMGLAVVHGIVDQAGGRLEVDSQPGVGTTFRMLLPAVDAPVERRRESIAPAIRGTETIVVVDDDELVRKSTARALRAHGYTVVEARDGYAAIGALAEHHVDLLLTDVVMPGMDGRQLVETACATHPQLQVLYMSGYTDDEAVRRGVVRGEAHLIEKPFRVPTLVAKVRGILDGRGAIPMVSAEAAAQAVAEIASPRTVTRRSISDFSLMNGGAS